MTYYARARDVSRGKPSTETRSDIFFLEVRPFNEEFEAAQSQAGMSGAGGDFDDLAKLQKDIIVATWRLDRRQAAGAGKSTADVKSVAKSQADLKAKAAQMAARMAAPAAPTRTRPGRGQTPPPPPAAAAPAQAGPGPDAAGRGRDGARAGRARRARHACGDPARERGAQRVAEGAGRGPAAAGGPAEPVGAADAADRVGTRTCRRSSTRSCSASSRPTTSRRRAPRAARSRTKTRTCGDCGSWRPARTR